MVKKLSQSIREYKKYAILTPICVAAEVILEIIIPHCIEPVSFTIEKLWDVETRRRDRTN